MGNLKTYKVPAHCNRNLFVCVCVCVYIHATPRSAEPPEQLEPLRTAIVDLNVYLPFLGDFSVTENWVVGLPILD